MITPKVIITVAPTGGMASKKQNPNLPTQPEEIAESVHRSYNEGASIVAVHARRPDDQATCNAEIYGRINSLIRDKCDIVINNSTGGGVDGDMVRTLRPGLEEIVFEERLKGADAPHCEMVTFDGHTIMAQFKGKNLLMVTPSDYCTKMAQYFKDRGVKPEWEVFSLAHLVQDTTRLIEAGYDKPPYYINMVLNAAGFQGGYPYSPKIVQLFVDHLPKDSIFCVSAIGSGQLPATTQAILMGGPKKPYPRGRLPPTRNRSPRARSPSPRAPHRRHGRRGGAPFSHPAPGRARGGARRLPRAQPSSSPCRPARSGP